MSGQCRVVGTAARDHDVVDGPGQVREEPFEATDVGGVEGFGVAGADLVGRGAKSFRVASGEDDVGAVRPCAARRFEADARARRRSRRRLAG